MSNSNNSANEEILKMRNKQKCKYWSLLAIAGFAAALLCGPSPALAQVAPPLGVLQQFGVLAAAGVTGQAGGGAVINGDVGSTPTLSIDNFPPSSVLAPFVLHFTNDGVVQQAKIDATAASTNLQGQGPGLVILDELGGTSRGPGIYSFSSTATISSGTTFTLDGAGIYIFLVGSSITAVSTSNVNLINGATACNVFWRVEASATLNGVNFPGTVIAGQSVTVGDNAILTGRAVALVGAVTMPGDGGTTIGGCAAGGAPVPPPNGVALSKAFSPATIAPGGVSTLTITLINANALPTTLTANLIDTLPLGVVIASTPNASTTCGGTGLGTVTAGDTTVSLLTGSTIPANSFCTVTVDVTAPPPGFGFLSNTLGIGALQTSPDLGITNFNNVDAASATLSVAVIPSEIPTLSEWAQLGMVLILVGVAVWHLRRRRAPVSA
jgi:hypothetical protein